MTMKDIWDEKPIPFYTAPPGGEGVYHTEKMDTWLEKLKAEGDRLQKEGLEHHAIAVEYYEKLEAVKELNREYDARPIYELDLVQFHNFRAKLWKLLGAEDT